MKIDHNGQMSKSVDQGSTMASHGAECQDGNSAEVMNAIMQKEEEKKPDIVIKGSELSLVMKECNLSRQDAIDLMTKAGGDLKASLKLYLHQ